jgi:hypothetical protein
VPFCEACDWHLTPTSMGVDGSCPACGRVLPPAERPAAPGRHPDGAEEAPQAPWHFKVLLVGLTGYLAWRGVPGVEWLAHKI